MTMLTKSFVDPSQFMDEKSWWDKWNTSYRIKEENDAVSNELFVRAAATVNKFTLNQTSSILEIACGTGTLSRMLRYSRYHGLDISPAAIEVAKHKCSSVSHSAGAYPTYESADFHEWPVPADPVDIVLCIDAISSIRDQPIAMKKMAQCLAVGGRLVLTTINRFVYQRIRRTSTVRLENGPVSHWLSRPELHALVEQAGLQIENSQTIMPRGNVGILRLINSPRVNNAFGPGVAASLRRLKEYGGLGQYSLVVARKEC